MECIFRNIRIIDPNSPNHQQVRDVWIKDGTIVEIKAKINLNKKVKEIQGKDTCLSPGWIDLGCLHGEPGFEHRETLESIANAACKGGYTSICCFPNTHPVIHSKSEVNFIKTKSENLPVHIYPIGALSKECKSEELAEILQMDEAGAIAFSDGKKPIQKSGLLMRALEYVRLIPNGLIINSSVDKGIAGSGQMHEAFTSTSLGLKGIPSLSETIHLYRDIEILKYTQSRLLIHKLSTAEAVSQLKLDRSKIKNLYCSVSVFNLLYNDTQLEDFNTNLKLEPPLRSERDRKALVKGVQDGTIDIICSDHTPWDTEMKDLEFQSAAFGAINLETAFAAYSTLLSKELSIDQWVQAVSINPAKILQIPISTIQVGSTGDFTWFDPNKEWTYKLEDSASLSKNSPFIGKTFKGKVLGCYSKSSFYSN